MACVVFAKTRHGCREQDTTASSFLTRAVVEVRCSAHRPFPAVIGSQWLRQPAGAPEDIVGISGIREEMWPGQPVALLLRAHRLAKTYLTIMS